MSQRLPAPIQAYLAGKKNNDTDAMLSAFGEAATVRDEGREMRGLTAIGKWMRKTNEKYQYAVEVTDVAESAATTTVACRLTGAFPGSPVDVNYAFALEDGKISSLDIS